MREEAMKKINKSEKHARALIESAKKIESIYADMISACERDQSANASERAADIALFSKEIERCKRMQAWWMLDCERMHEAKQALAAKQEAEKKKLSAAKQ